MPKPDVDPDLERQFGTARAGKPPIDIEALMRRVCQQSDDSETNYMPRIGALIV